MQKPLSKKINPLVNEIFPEVDLKHKYKVKKIIGKGQYGYVAKAVQKENNQFVAIKKLINVFQNEFQIKRILREIVLLKNCKHPNIVSLIQVLLPHNQTLQNFDTIYIVTEYCDTDLRKLFKLEETFLQIQDVKYILYQIACRIKYLHSASIIHRDLTPSNILINGQGMQIKICDLGLARVVQKKSVQNVEENSSDQQKLQSEINSLTLQERQSIKNDLLNVQHIDSESPPSTPNTPNIEKKQLEANFDNPDQFVMKRRHTNESVKIEIQPESDLSSSGNLDDLRGSHKNGFQTKQATKKKRGLKRMNSKRTEQADVFDTQKIQEIKILSPTYKQEKKKLLNNPISKITLRVTTRQYRAPEIILLEKGYHKHIDIWSLGCLFGELLKMMKSVCYNSLHRFPLFPGKYCYPVSPATLCNIHNEAAKSQHSSSFKQDQFFMILSTIGKPTEEQMSFLTDQTAKDYIRLIQNLQRKHFSIFFPSVPKQAISILEGTLLFDPNSRLSIDEVINHPFLDSVKNKQFQKNTSSIIMQFQEEENITLQILRDYLASQIKIFL